VTQPAVMRQRSSSVAATSIGSRAVTWAIAAAGFAVGGYAFHSEGSAGCRWLLRGSTGRGRTDTGGRRRMLAWQHNKTF